MFTDDSQTPRPLATQPDQRCLAERCFAILAEHRDPSMTVDECKRLLIERLGHMDDSPSPTDMWIVDWTMDEVIALWFEGDGWRPTGWPAWYTHTSGGTCVSDEMRWACWASHWDDSPCSDPETCPEYVLDYQRRARERVPASDLPVPPDLAELLDLNPDGTPKFVAPRVVWAKEGF